MTHKTRRDGRAAPSLEHQKSQSPEEAVPGRSVLRCPSRRWFLGVSALAALPSFAWAESSRPLVAIQPLGSALP
jgi:hypothetical protein